MEGSRYFVRGRTFAGGETALRDALAQVYEYVGAPTMHVRERRRGDVCREARGIGHGGCPGTGHLHHVACHSFEPEAGVSGIGELMGEAIVEHAPRSRSRSGRRSRSRGWPGKPLPRGEPSDDPSSINAPRKRMSLRAVLSLPVRPRWVQPVVSGDGWSPIADRVICRFLTAASRGVTLKGGTLEERLFVPEQFRVAEAEEIGERRRRKLAMLLSPEADVQFKMAILIGQLTGVESTAYGRRMTVKHMPDVALYIDNKAWEKAERAYKTILQAVDADVEHKPRVLMAALIYAKREHTYQVDSLTLMLVTDQWVPLDGLYEFPLIEALTRQGRAFIKPLKFDAKTAAGFPNVLLLDAGAAPVPLNVVSPFMDAKDRAIKEKIIKTAAGAGWCSETDKEMPPLPTRVNTSRQPPACDNWGGRIQRSPETREQQLANDFCNTPRARRQTLWRTRSSIQWQCSSRDNLRGQPGHAALFVPFHHVMSNRKHCSACWADVLRKLTIELQSIHADSQPILYLDNVPADSLAEVSEMFSTLRETRRDLRLVLRYRAGLKTGAKAS